jgi:hypothetical protein
MTAANARERRWLLLAEDGAHSWLGRATDPTDEEIASAEEALARAGTGGFLAVSEGDYWSAAPMSLMQVRQLNGPGASFEAAVSAFLARRRAAVDGGDS